MTTIERVNYHGHPPPYPTTPSNSLKYEGPLNYHLDMLDDRFVFPYIIFFFTTTIFFNLEDGIKNIELIINMTLFVKFL